MLMSAGMAAKLGCIRVERPTAKGLRTTLGALKWKRDAPDSVIVTASDDGSVWLMPRRITTDEAVTGH